MARRLTTEEARARALQAARDIVAEKGLRGFTIDAVAERSGVAKTTIYRGWPSGQELMLQAVTSTISDQPTPNTGSIRQDLIEIFTGILHQADTTGLRQTLLSVMAAAAVEPALEEIRLRMMTNTANPLRTILELAQLRGELPADLDLEVAAELLVGPVFYRRIIHDKKVSPERLATYVDTILASLRLIDPETSPSETG